MSERLQIAISAGAAAAFKDAAWYAFAAGLLWLAFDGLFRRVMARRKVVQRVASWQQLRVEVFRSLRSTAVFGITTGIVVFAALGGHTRLYRRVEDYGWVWFVMSIAVAVVIHDTYFYWTHRLMHRRWLFRRFHRTHHLSTSPTPWAAYSFSVSEAFVQAGIGPLLVFTIPMHPLAFLIFMTWQVTFNVLGHCGYEIFPRWFLQSNLGRLLNTPTHHAMHHEKVHGNYGLYFNVWDRILGTNHPDYETRFAEAVGEVPSAQAASMAIASHPSGRVG